MGNYFQLPEWNKMFWLPFLFCSFAVGVTSLFALYLPSIYDMGVAANYFKIIMIALAVYFCLGYFIRDRLKYLAELEERWKKEHSKIIKLPFFPWNLKQETFV